MKEILDKITSYNLFNYLLPGILFVVILEKITSYTFIQKDVIIGAFVYYFIGLVISRFGSLLVEPFLKKISFLEFADYKDFVSASKKDPKIEIFSEANNMYRTLSAMFILLISIKLYEVFRDKILYPVEWNIHILVVLLLVMFLFSYRKQTAYVVKRVNAIKE